MNKNSSLGSWLTFFTSFSTLLCCALPAVLVGLGAGATLISLFTQFPFLITLSENKEIVWLVAGVLLGANGVWIYKQKNAPCPLDPALALKCTQARVLSYRIWISSLVVYLIGVGLALIPAIW